MTIPHSPSRIVVGLSGGVDSAVAALLLQQQGHDISAMFMKNWEEDDSDGYCSAAADLADARAVSEALGIPLSAVNFSAEYWERVFENFLAELRAGRTPNPDVLCNREVKFRAFLDHALDHGADFIATGHYARIRHHADGVQLLKGLDPGKDQSYFLHLLDQHQLGKSVFPLGELPKSEVRTLAQHAGLANHAKKDSTGICFIGERHFSRFLSRYLHSEPGPMRTPAGDTVGEHQGLPFYTIGQRQGLGLGGSRGGSGEPWYVAAKRLQDNSLLVVQGHDHPALLASGLSAGVPHWIAGHPPSLPLQCHAKTRYRQSDLACTVHPGDDGKLLVQFNQPTWGVAPGQSVVFYADEVCLGGAIIEHALPI